MFVALRLCILVPFRVGLLRVMYPALVFSLAQAFTPGNQVANDPLPFVFAPLRGQKRREEDAALTRFPAVNGWAREKPATMIGTKPAQENYRYSPQNR